MLLTLKEEWKSIQSVMYRILLNEYFIEGIPSQLPDCVSLDFLNHARMRFVDKFAKTSVWLCCLFHYACKPGDSSLWNFDNFHS